jgi:hypothetical protein
MMLRAGSLSTMSTNAMRQLLLVTGDCLLFTAPCSGGTCMRVCAVYAYILGREERALGTTGTRIATYHRPSLEFQIPLFPVQKLRRVYQSSPEFIGVPSPASQYDGSELV